MRLNVLSFRAPVLEAKNPIADAKPPLRARNKETEIDSAQVDDAAVIKLTKGHCGTGNKKDFLSPDLDGDGSVGLSDLAIMLSHWGQEDAQSDLDQDGKVNDRDLKFLLKNYGQAVK